MHGVKYINELKVEPSEYLTFEVNCN